MAWCEVHWFSRVLEKQVTTGVLLPEGGSPPFAAMYLLHGLSDDHTMWHRRTRIEWYARNLPLIIVMPDGFRGFYTDNNQGPAYAQYLADELPTFIERTFPAKSDAASRCISGLSMGGYGALRLALGYPGRYASAHSMSGALMHGSRPADASRAEFPRIFGDDPTGTSHDLLHLARTTHAAGVMPQVLVDCGTEDFLIEDNRAFHQRLKEMQIPHRYKEHPGTHDWDYWDLHVQTSLRLHGSVMGIV